MTPQHAPCEVRKEHAGVEERRRHARHVVAQRCERRASGARQHGEVPSAARQRVMCVMRAERAALDVAAVLHGAGGGAPQLRPKLALWQAERSAGGVSVRCRCAARVGCACVTPLCVGVYRRRGGARKRCAQLRGATCAPARVCAACPARVCAQRAARATRRNASLSRLSRVRSARTSTRPGGGAPPAPKRRAANSFAMRSYDTSVYVLRKRRRTQTAPASAVA
jgi:hypothetical protein